MIVASYVSKYTVEMFRNYEDAMYIVFRFPGSTIQDK